MIVSATDLKNNLGKYLRASATEDILITSNGREVARLTGIESVGQAVGRPVIQFVEKPSDKSVDESASYSQSQPAYDANKAAFYESYLREQAEAFAQFPRKASFEEFQQLSESSDERYEYIDGEIYMMASPRATHQQILGELHGIFYNWFAGKQCRPMLAPFDITLRRFENGKNKSVVQPDIMVICDLEEKLNERDYYDGVPSLVVEILSERTRGKDSVKKLDLYMSTGIHEYWIVNPLSSEVTVFLFENNDLTKSLTYKKGERIASFIFEGLEVNLDSIMPGI
ncbi:MAG: type II toxin-antitoxin system prevent-host-death family antitoxin [Clostridiaceae bacterium]|jgi:prevent-host-death family protein|nr:type II toxin-antitoxin system prevent-host-death family antitoxin [Clostridiaceae bacterium]